MGSLPSARFQAYLRGEAGSCDHATAGAQLVRCHYGDPFGKLLAYVVAGHHAGLPDGLGGERVPLAERLRKRIEPFDRWPEVVTLPNGLQPRSFTPRDNRRGFQLAFFTRMLFSCLVDAIAWRPGGFTARGARPGRPGRQARRAPRSLRT